MVAIEQRGDSCSVSARRRTLTVEVGEHATLEFRGGGGGSWSTWQQHGDGGRQAAGDCVKQGSGWQPAGHDRNERRMAKLLGPFNAVV